MTPDDLDRILAAEEPLVPSSGFAASVLAEVRRQALAPAPPPLPFPWLPFLVGLAAAAALAVLCLRLAPDLPALHAPAAALADALAALADPRVPRPLAAAAGALVGSYLLVRVTFVFTATRH